MSRTPNGRDQHRDLATVAIMLSIDEIVPNRWNPNVQPDEIYAKELASIRKFGFVDPVAVRQVENEESSGFWYEIVDGEHRWRAAKELGYLELPCWNLGFIDQADAEELTVVLNETKGRPDEVRLRAVLQDLIARRGSDEPVRAIMPFSRERFDEIIGKRSVDWDALEKRREALQGEGRWKEVVYRMPYEAAATVEQAVLEVKEREGFDDSWRALEMICRDAIA